MDLNNLYFKHQILRMQATAADCGVARDRINDAAAEVAHRIGRAQHALGAAAAASWTAMAAARAASDRGARPAAHAPLSVAGDHLDGAAR